MMRVAALSPREATVLHLIAWGHANKEIASRLSISVKTVEAHKYNAMRKLQFTSKVQVVEYAVREGWLTLKHPTAAEPCSAGAAATPEHREPAA